jgi:hypothetical protein
MGLGIVQKHAWAPSFVKIATHGDEGLLGIEA